MMDPELAELHAQTVTIAPYVSRDAAQKPTYGAAANYAARVELGAHHVVTPEGKTVQAQGVVYLVPPDDTTIVPTTRDLLTLPSNYPNRTPPIVAVVAQPDEFGALYSIEVHF